MVKVALIDPEGSTPGLNAGIGYLCGALESRHDVSVFVFDFNNYTGNRRKLLHSIQGYDLVGISIKTFTLAKGLEYAKYLASKNGPIIFGGSHCATDKGEFLLDVPEAAGAVLYEGEDAILELVDWVRGKLNLTQIKGIVYLENGRLTYTESRPLNDKLAMLPFPLYSLFNYIKKTHEYPLVSSRGCPYSCTYCSVPNVVGRKWRFRPAENIIEELKIAKEKYGILGFEILDDNFTLDISRAKKVCKLLIDEKLNLKWKCANGIRADRVDEELLSMMKAAGCNYVMFGIESGDPEIFKATKKGETLEDIEKAVFWAQKAGIKVGASLIIGLPGSTSRTFGKSLEFVQKLKLDRVGWNILSPYPGTEAYKWMLQESKVLRPWEEGFHFGESPLPVFETDSLSAKLMVKQFKTGHLAMANYSRYFGGNSNYMLQTFKLLRDAMVYDFLRLPLHVGRVFVFAAKKFCGMGR